ncbi:7-cyano-7-deazaguanine synthase QueC [Luteolibacter flavescens]|uniref:7-cyano-7-deazaguanine synthase n=1 Tax=Luteolibacter flavescens TaxID=1859460 RepID=A0ABT3FT25_9BACT|nr:7-cyano-7-deazaguanine synthase QueC [Luteolibacter flavescens]MCW1886733.1 7-cyano-7-deazaguanine synthase QueC [Luteolibacter flavescens]
MPEKMKVVVLLSGGMDSVTVLYDVAEKHQVVGTLGFEYGSKHNPRELPMAAWHAARLGVPHQVIPLGFVNELFASDLLQSGGQIPEGHYEESNMKATVVPFRNGIMLSIAAGYAESRGADALVIAAHSGDHAVYPDCREDFMQSMGDAIRLGTYAGIQVLRPFIAMRKEDIASRGAELGIDYSKTWSCYKGGEIHCGKCGTCVERREAFLISGVPDPTEYLETGPLPAKPVATR